MITESDVVDFLKAYNIDLTNYGTNWIDDRITNRIVPMLEEKFGFSFSSVDDVISYHDGLGEPVLYLDTRNALSLVNVVLLDSINVNYEFTFELNKREGYIRAIYSDDYMNDPVFPRGTRNIKVTLSVGYLDADLPADIKECILLLSAADLLAFEAGKDGGGKTLSVVAWSKGYGDLGKYSEIRKEFAYQAFIIMKRYTSAVVGQ